MPRSRQARASGRHEKADSRWRWHGGTPPLRAAALLGNFANGMAIDFTDGSLIIRDTVTSANNFQGRFKDRFTVVGNLDPAGINGPLFNVSNYASIPVSQLPWSASAGTLYAECSTDVAPVGSQRVVNIHDGTITERISLIFTALPTTNLNIVDAGSAVASISRGVPVPSVIGRCSYAWALGDAAGCFDGGAISAAAPATLPTVTSFHIGVRGSTIVEGLDGRIRRLVWLPQRISNAGLQAGPSGWT